MCFFPDMSSTEEGSQGVGAPKELDEDQLAKAVSQTTQDLGTMDHPQAIRAKKVQGQNSASGNASIENTEQVQRPRLRDINLRNLFGGTQSSEKDEEEPQRFRASKRFRENYSDDEESDGDTKFVEQCPFGCPYKSGNKMFMKAHISKCPVKDNPSSTDAASNSSFNPNGKYLIKQYVRVVEAGTDDNINILAKERFYTSPAGVPALYSQMPIRVQPVRTNYNFSEFGLVINNPKPIITLHDRSNTNLKLAMFTESALGKMEMSLSWKPGTSTSSMVMNEEYQDIKKLKPAIFAVKNFCQIHHRIWPLDMSPDALYNAVLNQTNTAFGPSAEDVSELFAHFIQDRANSAMEGKPPINFVQLQSYFNGLCQRNNQIQAKQNGAPQDGFTYDKRNNYQRNNPPKGWNNNLQRSGGSGGKRSRYEFQNAPAQVLDNTCFGFNSPTGCSTHIPAGGACMGKRGQRWLHVCNSIDQTGLLCKGKHSVMEHK